MCISRPLSLYRASLDTALASLLEGPHLGYLVVLDEEFEAHATCCWGLYRNPCLSGLPFSQNRVLTVWYTSSDGRTNYTYDVFFFPVLSQPLSSNRYCIFWAKGTHAGADVIPRVALESNYEEGKLIFPLGKGA